MYYLNKIVGAILNPLGAGMVMILLALGLAWLKKRRPSTPTPLIYACALLAVAWLWFWSMGVTGRLIGLPLEREFPPQLAEAMPTADAIVVLGGGVGENTNACPYAELFQAADRAWHGARLYKAGKAPRVFVTLEADARFMIDLGVPREAITVNDQARNTEEEARGIVKLLDCSDCLIGRTNGGDGSGASNQAIKQSNNQTILLVTSAWHMRRAKLMYERYAKGVEVIPAAADHEGTTLFDKPLEFKDFVPDPGALAYNAFMFKEWIAYWGYRWLRR